MSVANINMQNCLKIKTQIGPHSLQRIFREECVTSGFAKNTLMKDFCTMLSWRDWSNAKENVLFIYSPSGQFVLNLVVLNSGLRALPCTFSVSLIWHSRISIWLSLLTWCWSETGVLSKEDKQNVQWIENPCLNHNRKFELNEKIINRGDKMNTDDILRSYKVYKDRSEQKTENFSSICSLGKCPDHNSLKHELLVR